MKFKTLFYLMLLSSLTVACGSNYEYWDISEFNMNEGALKDGEEVKVIYNNQGPDNNSDLDYYIHMIVVSQESGDTVNVLTIANTVYYDEHKGKTLNYYDQNNLATKALQRLGDAESIEEIENTEKLEIDQVARDPKFDHVADNEFPTVIGSIGKTTKK